MSIMTASEFCDRLVDCSNHKTLYVMGCFGAPMNKKNKLRYTSNNAYNAKADRTRMIMAATDDTFGFDCIGLVKGILFGWLGDVNRVYGGAGYKENGVPDTDAKKMLNYCTDVSTDFSHILPGEFLWMDGHCGVYIGNGKVAESSPKWKNGVQITYLANLGYTEGNCRTWTKHGKLEWIDYSDVTDIKKEPTATVTRYTVKPGDTLSKISKLYGSSVGEIVAVNGIENPNRISVGQILVIPNHSNGFMKYGVTTTVLNIRKSPTIFSKKVGALTLGTRVEISEISGSWGHLLDGRGWISLDYAVRIE